jgi:signal transduction histidine kinase
MNGGVQLIAEDCGRGVEPEFVPRLFERFARSSASDSLNYNGAGLGLSIARSYAYALGGDLIYEPVDPTGARFALVLPPDVLS